MSAWILTIVLLGALPHRAGRVRVLGAIRAAKQCIDCHGGGRGDLLGAFS